MFGVGFSVCSSRLFRCFYKIDIKSYSLDTLLIRITVHLDTSGSNLSFNLAGTTSYPRTQKSEVWVGLGGTYKYYFSRRNGKGGRRRRKVQYSYSHPHWDMPSSYRYHLLVLTSAFTSWTSSAIVFRSISTTRRTFLTPAFVTNQPFFPRISHPFRTKYSIHRSIMSHHGTNDVALPEITFDKSQFDRTIDLVALNIPAKSCTIFTTALKGWVLSRPRTKKIYDVPMIRSTI